VGGPIEAVLEPFGRKGRIRYYIRSKGPFRVSFVDNGNRGHGSAASGVVERIDGQGSRARGVWIAGCGVWCSGWRYVRRANGHGA
jgi:hypothetical protein